ncbi:transmembrane protein 234 homolog [Ischnura elegans]|uniref:transmembrane protein 234 homolog n=1 Tax=Ischnura elegans TaxID=197161 RepID=UPI001ED8895A|nr:transmembrane protein 234 homolog [Ischnura elegans]XP_046386280.1 transmembrane protein 234 homolog [Ischnura elegans]XP_046386281.1 transmembrane protein 234 homolog [Ischnura elegans]XP_046386282.1 transmembrane protein 234 homolog [Ischnura elegans]
MGFSIANACLAIVALLWGATNPLIRKGAVGADRVKEGNVILRSLLEIKFLVLDWKYSIPFLINQSGSVLYFFTLHHTDISLAVPLTNSLTFLFTWMMGRIIGEEPVSKRTVLGMLSIIIGISLCCLDKAG